MRKSYLGFVYNCSLTTLVQMPATRPHDAEPTGDPDVILHHPENPFTLHYDKLIIAVGAYSQSEVT